MKSLYVFRNRSFIRYMIDNILSDSVICLFILFMELFREEFQKQSPIYQVFALRGHGFSAISKKSLPTQAYKFSPVFFFRNLYYIVRFMIYFILNFVSNEVWEFIFAYGYPVVSTVFAETAIFSLHLCLSQKSVFHIYREPYFWFLSFLHLLIVTPVPHSLDHCGFLVRLEIRLFDWLCLLQSCLVCSVSSLCFSKGILESSW